MRYVILILTLPFLLTLYPLLLLLQWTAGHFRRAPHVPKFPGNRLVFFCRVFHPNEQANAGHLTQLCRNLSRTANVEVVCNIPLDENEMKGITVRRWPPLFELPWLRVRVTDYLHSTISLFLMQWSYSKDCTFVLWTDPPFLDTWLGTICRWRGIKYYAWLQDWYPQNLIGLGLVPRGLAAGLRRWQTWVYRSAEKIICISTDTQKMLAGQGLRNTVVIENWGESAGVRPLVKRGRPQWGNGLAKDRFTVMFAGNFGLGLDTSLMEKVLAGIRNPEEYLFVFHGKGMRRPALERIVARYPHALLSGWLPREEVAGILTQCDAHLVLLMAPLMGAIFPSKIYSMMSTGKPIVALAPKTSMLYEMVGKIGCGFAADSADADDVIAVLEKMNRLFRKDPAALARMGKAGRRHMDSVWNDERAAQAFLDLVNGPARKARKRKTSSRA